MTSNEEFKKEALSFPDTCELPHFEKTSFRLGKKIFATLDNTKHLTCIKLNEIDQNIFCTYNNVSIYPVPNKWGKEGWTFLDLNNLTIDEVREILNTSYHLLKL